VTERETLVNALEQKLGELARRMVGQHAAAVELGQVALEALGLADPVVEPDDVGVVTSLDGARIEVVEDQTGGDA
jgi:hypothetical protein